MSDITSSDVLELLNKLDPQAFELLVEDVARSTFPTATVHRQWRLGSMGADVVAQLADASSGDAVLIVFEAKRVQLVTMDLLRSQVARREILRMEHQNVQFILAVSGQLTAAARSAAERYALTVWDGPYIVARLSPELRTKWFGAIGVEPAVDLRQSKGRLLIDALHEISPGEKDALIYQKWVADAFEYLFVPPLGPVHYEDSDLDRRNRRDLILENWAPDGFWSQVRTAYGADQVVIDAKNYSGFLKKRPVLDLSHYLKPYGCGTFGIICSRKGAGPSAMHAIREHWIGGNKMILPLSDALVIEMLRLKPTGTPPEEILRRHVANFRKSL
jgi:hypothetical protein